MVAIMHQRPGGRRGADTAEEDRRFRRAQWRILWATMLCYFFYYTGRQTFGFAIPGIEQELGISKAGLGWVSSAMLWCYAAGQAVNGNLGDRFGGRRMMSLGALLSCLFNWGVSFAGGLVGLMVPWAINGYVQSMGWAPGSRVLSNWWSRRERGKVYGLYVGAAGLSSVLAFTTSNLILSLDLDWRWIFRLPVLLLLLGGAFYYRVARDRPEDLGFSGSDHLEGNRAEAGAGPPGKEDTEETTWNRYRQVFSNWRFMIASLAIGFQSLARYGLLTWVPVHFLGAGWRGFAGRTWITLALPAGMTLGAVSSGWLSDRFFHSNRSRVIFLFMAAASLACTSMYLLPYHFFWSMALLALCGFFTYGPQSAFWALCPDLLGTRYAGTGTGVMNTHAYLLAGLGEPFIGWMIQRSDDNTGMVFPLVAGACLLSGSIALFVRR
jgi:OPA family glycerol-3-phosphate transporter-like MFS transporter